MAPPVEGGGGRHANGGGAGGRRPQAIQIASGAPIGAQACSPPRPFKQPSVVPPAGNGVVPQMSKASVSSLTSSAVVSAPPTPRRVWLRAHAAHGQPSAGAHPGAAPGLGERFGAPLRCHLCLRAGGEGDLSVWTLVACARRRRRAATRSMHAP